jgi:hypothetical protein
MVPVDVIFPSGDHAVPEHVRVRSLTSGRGPIPTGARPGDSKEPLFAQILRRHTNRSLYDLSRPMPPDAWKAMADAVKPNPLRFGFVGTDQPHDFSGLGHCGRGLAHQLTTPRTILNRTGGARRPR